MAVRYGGKGPAHLSRWTGGASSPYAADALALDFKNGQYWNGGVQYGAADKALGAATGWTNDSWDTFVANGGGFTASKDISGGTDLAYSTNTFPVTLGAFYDITVTVAATTLAQYSIGLSAGFNSRSDAATLSGSGAFTVRVQANVAGGNFSIYTKTTNVGSITITNASVKEVAGVQQFPGYSFSRSGIKAEPTATGVSAPFAANVPAITDKGYYSEAAFTNLLKNSADFTLTWTAEGSSVVANATTAPDGTMTADQLVEDAATNRHNIYQSAAVTAASPYTVSVFLKQGTRRYGGITYFGSSTEYYTVVVDLQTGEVTATSTGTGGVTATQYHVEAFADGFYRISATATLPTVTSGYAIPFMSDAAVPGVYTNGRPRYLGDGTGSIYLWQGQLVAGSLPGPIIPTTTAAASVGADALSVTSPYTADQDFVVWAIINFGDASHVNDDVVLNLGSSSTSRITLARRASTGVAVLDMNNGSDNSVTAGAAINAERAVFLFRRRGGKNTLAVKNGAGTVTIGVETGTVTFPPSLAASILIGQYIGGSFQPRGSIEGAFARTGTFSDADLTALLQAA